MNRKKRSRRGDWIRRAVEVHREELMLYAIGFFGDAGRSSRAVLAAFEKLCQKKREQIESRLKFRLFQICRKTVFDLMREEIRMSAEEEKLVPLDPVNRLEALEMENASWKALRSLPEVQQELGRLRWIHGFDDREIEELTAIPRESIARQREMDVEVFFRSGLVKGDDSKREEILSGELKKFFPPGMRPWHLARLEEVLVEYDRQADESGWQFPEYVRTRLVMVGMLVVTLMMLEMCRNEHWRRQEEENKPVDPPPISTKDF